MSSRERGASGIFVAVVLLALAAGIMVILALSNISSKGDRSRQTVASLATIQAALQTYLTANKRLPCPANPNATDGLEVAAGNACTFPAGVIPRVTLGLKTDDVVDPWGGMISYRVFDGATGFTRANGASMVDCTTNAAATGFLIAGACDPVHDTPEQTFLNGKGLRVNDFGTVKTDAAYVLISHGTSGLGSFTAAGGQKTPLPTSADELANLSGVAGTTYVAKAASAETVGPEDAAHFDDVVAYASIAPLIRTAGLGGRAWAAPPAFASTRLDAATIQAALGLGAPPATGSLGVTTIDFGTATITGGNSGGAANITFTSASVDGIGITGGQLQSAQNEFVTIAFDRAAGWFAFSAFNLNTTVVGGTLRKEQVRLTFSLAGTTVAVKTVQACSAAPAVASYSVNVASLYGTQFDTVEVKPVTAEPSGNTAFYLSEFDTCSAGAPSCPSGLAQADPTTICP